MKKASIIILVLLVASLVLIFWPRVGNAPSDGDNQIFCTMEAKLCPEGSYVGRSGPKCEFARCPDDGDQLNGQAIVKGVVTLSPVCPVERIPPDPNCAPKPYQTMIQVFSVDGAELVKTLQSQSDGSFTFALPYGDYYLEAGKGKVLPRCETVNLSLKTPSPSLITVSCDTGIR